MIRTTVIGITAVLFIAASLASAAPKYKVIDLGPVAGATDTSARAINLHRTVVGRANSPDLPNSDHAVEWKRSAWPEDLNISAPDAQFAISVNDPGLVVLRSDFGPGNHYSWLLTPNVGIDLLAAPPSFLGLGVSVYAAKVNNSGVVAGTAAYETPAWQQFVNLALIWRNGPNGPAYEILPSLFGSLLPSTAQTISDSGLVAGLVGALPVLWDTNNGNTPQLLPGVPAGASFLGIDPKASWLVGQYPGQPYPYPFVYFRKGQLAGTWLNPAPGNATGRATGVNGSGQVVGQVDISSRGVSGFGFLWDEQHGFQNLNDLIPNPSVATGGFFSLGWVLSQATGINEHGDIIGIGTLFESGGPATGSVHGFLLVHDDDPPAVNCGKADGQWHKFNLTFNCVANDAIAGLQVPSDIAFTLATSVAADTENASAVTDSRKVCDAVDNCVTAQVAGNKVDRKAPVVTCGSPDGQWHAGNVFIACSSQDNGSGVLFSGFFLQTSVPAGTETASAATPSSQACDRVQNCTSVAPIPGNKVDRRAPSISLTSPQQGSVHTVGEVFPAQFSCTDAGSGLANCTGDVSAGTPLDTSRTGVFPFTVKAVDNVGNNSQTTVDYQVTWGICAGHQIFNLGSVAKILVTLCDASGVPGGSGRLAVTATGIAPGLLQGQSPAFRSQGQGVWEFDLDTRNFAAGAYDLQFRVAQDPVLHHVQFQLVSRVGQ